MEKKNDVSWSDFEKIDLRVGTILAVNDFLEARKPAYQLQIDFGSEIGILKTSAQITKRYSKEDLINRQIVAIVNFPKKQIGPIQSECLVTGFHNQDGHVTLCVPDTNVPLGTKLL